MSHKHIELRVSQIFKQQKTLICIVTFLIICLTGIVIFNHQTVYEARLIVESPSEIDSWLLNSNPWSLLKEPQTEQFTSEQLFSIFLFMLNQDETRTLFFNEVYYPEEKRSHLNSSKQELYKQFIKNISGFYEFSSKQQRYVFLSKAESAQKAEKQLKEYVFFIDNRAKKYIKTRLESRKQLIIFELKEQIKKMSKSHQANFKQNNDVVSVDMANQLIALYGKSYDLYIDKVIKNDEFRLFAINGNVIISSTAITSKLKTTLLLGGWSGLLLAFLIAAFRAQPR